MLRKREKSIYRELTLERLKEILRYDPESGNFYWLEDRSSGVSAVEAGTIAGSINAQGYIQIGVLGCKLLAHRLAHFYMTGRWCRIDHRDTIKTNNRWFNLREATQRQNAQNMSMHKDNRSGMKGVSWNAQKSKWVAQICLNGRQTNLGRFNSALEAKAAYDDAAKKHFGEFARL